MSPGASGQKSARNRKRANMQRAALATLSCLLAFSALWAGASVLYPGGTFLDRSQVGQSFLGNFLCDLTQPVSLSGVPNPVGSRLAQCGMVCFAAALGGLFWLVPWHFAGGRRVRRWILGFGTLSVLTLIAVALTPSEQFGKFHAALALLAGGFGIVATLAAVWALFASHSRARVLGVLGALALAAGAFAAVIFSQHFGESAPPPLLVPAAQKVAALLVTVWIAAVALRVLLDEDSRQA
jgi:hypothetical protein